MQDRDLYQEIPGLKSPWSVMNVTLNLKEQQVDAFVEHPSGTELCWPECSLTLPCYDHTSERQWRHLDSCQFKTLLHASIPRVNRPGHGYGNSWNKVGSDRVDCGACCRARQGSRGSEGCAVAWDRREGISQGTTATSRCFPTLTTALSKPSVTETIQTVELPGFFSFLTLRSNLSRRSRQWPWIKCAATSIGNS